MVVTTRAIVISSLKYAEADLIVNCYTESFGLKGYLQRNILKSKKGKIRTSYFQPLTQLEITAVHKNKGTLERISEAKVLQHYKTLHTDVVKSSVVMFLSEVLKGVLREEHPNHELFEYLEQSLVWLDEHDEIANFHLLFLLQLTAYLGFYPDATKMDGDYFNLNDGIFEKTPSGNACLKGPAITAFKGLFGIDFDALASLKLAKKTRSEVLDLLLVYYQLHLQGFKKPKSLLVLNQLFN